jgi:L,D-peptidoglycan transpeptidase YkuD (ErfK/YbiS/YcfS/YnhG family)
MIIMVHPGGEKEAPHHGILQAGEREYPCALGRAGISADKREGDGATPAGRFTLRRILYRADRLTSLSTALPFTAIGPDDGWCDAADHPQYNQPARLPFAASAEKLWREDGLYDLVVIIGHNDDPAIAGAGSAIFLHVAGPAFAPTEGCVALERDVLVTLVAALKPGDEIAMNETGRR